MSDLQFLIQQLNNTERLTQGAIKALDNISRSLDNLNIRVSRYERVSKAPGEFSETELIDIAGRLVNKHIKQMRADLLKRLDVAIKTPPAEYDYFVFSTRLRKAFSDPEVIQYRIKPNTRGLEIFVDTSDFGDKYDWLDAVRIARETQELGRNEEKAYIIWRDYIYGPAREGRNELQTYGKGKRAHTSNRKFSKRVTYLGILLERLSYLSNYKIPYWYYLNYGSDSGAYPMSRPTYFIEKFNDYWNSLLGIEFISELRNATPEEETRFVPYEQKQRDVQLSQQMDRLVGALNDFINGYGEIGDTVATFNSAESEIRFIIKKPLTGSLQPRLRIRRYRIQ